MAEDFARAVDDGLRLSKRIYFGKDRAVAPPRPLVSMEKSAEAYLPTAPMVYAVISDPGIVDNPDISSYQPYVHGRCDPPALIPLQMNGIQLEADCYLDTAFIKVTGTWRVHCVMGSRSCDCRIAIPMGEQGSVLGVEVSVLKKSYSTQLVAVKDNDDKERAVQPEDGGFLKPNIFTIRIPEFDGGTNLSIKLNWSQKIIYRNGEFLLNIPFTFPDFVNPAGKRVAKRTKIQVNVNAGTGSELICTTISHPLKEVERNDGSMRFLYDSDVLFWSGTDISFSYAVTSTHIEGNVLLESASTHDYDQREMFAIYLSSGNLQSMKVFRKDIVFVVDISGSMRGKLIDDTKNAISAALSKLNPDDSFNIIAFNGETYLFSTSMELASKDSVEKAIDWINLNFVAGGGTNILHPLNTAMEMLSAAHKSVPIVFLVTDGTVEDERQICDMVKKHIINGESMCPRIYTCGIGPFCNHYFLRILARIGRGQYDAALDANLVEQKMLKLYEKAASLVLANININIFNDLDDVEVYPSSIPDLSSEGQLVLSGRYKGSFPESLKVKGVLADFSDFVVDMKIRKAKDIPLQKVSAREQIEHLTAEAWLSGNKEIEQKVAKLSLQTGFTSEYTRMVLLEDDHLKKIKEKDGKKASKKTEQRMIMLPKLGIGFGNLTATAENILPGTEEPKGPEAAQIFVDAATNCCNSLWNQCCCMCCIHVCSKMNNQCVNVLTQFCVGIGCVGCLNCCAEICCCAYDG